MKNALRTLSKEHNLKIKTGLYRDHEGKLFFVEGSAKDSSTLEDMVIYQSMYVDATFGSYPTWVMPLSTFLSEIEVDDKKMLRFNFIGNEETIKFETELIFLLGRTK